MVRPPASETRRLLVLRTAQAAEKTAQKARALGFSVTTGVLWQGVSLADTEPSRQVQIAGLLTLLAQAHQAPILLTSPNAVSALKPLLAESAELRTGLALRTVFVVGDQTAEAVRAMGFTSVRTAAGDGASLAKLVLDSFKSPLKSPVEPPVERFVEPTVKSPVKPHKPPTSSLQAPEGAFQQAIHLCGRVRADEPHSTLERAGWQVVPVPLYEMRPASCLPQSAQAFLADSPTQESQENRAENRYILLTSSEAVRVFAELLAQESKESAESRQKYPLAGIVALVPSESVARTVRSLFADLSVRLTQELP